MIVLDEDLDVAAVRLYRQEAAAGEYRVAVETAEPARVGSLAQRLETVVDPLGEPWAAFSATAAAAVAERQAALARIIAH